MKKDRKKEIKEMETRVSDSLFLFSSLIRVMVYCVPDHGDRLPINARAHTHTHTHTQYQKLEDKLQEAKRSNRISTTSTGSSKFHVESPTSCEHTHTHTHTRMLPTLLLTACLVLQ